MKPALVVSVEEGEFDEGTVRDFKEYWNAIQAAEDINSKPIEKAKLRYIHNGISLSEFEDVLENRL